MEKQELNDLLATLKGDGVVLDREKIESEVSSNSALYANKAVKLLSVFGGIIGSFFLLLFFLTLGLADSAIGQIVFGLMLFGGAIAISKTDTPVFFDTANVSMWMIGVGLIGVGLSINDDRAGFIAIIMILLGTLTFFLTRKFLLRFLSVLLICASMVGFVMINEWLNLIHLIIIGCVLKMTYVHLYEADLISKNEFFNSSYAPLRLGLIFSLIGLLFLVGKGGSISDLEFNYIWVSSLVIIGANLFSVNKIMDGLEIAHRKRILVMALATIIFLPTVFSPFISGAILILILNYHLGYRAGIAIGIIALIYSVSQYYYDLNLTLLHKSIVLMTSGTLFLLAYLIFNKKIAGHEEV